MRRSVSLAASLGVLSLSLLALHCGAEDALGTSEADHTAGEYIHENSVYAWAEPDFEEFEELKNAQSWDRRARLADDHPAVLRLQAWVDRFDAVIRAHVAEQGQELLAPRPTAIVYQDATVNAWVSWFPACLGDVGTEAAFEGGDGGAPGSGSPNRIDREKVELFGAYPKCLTPRNWPALGAELASWWNASEPACRLTSREGTERPSFSIGGEGCDTQALGTTPRQGVMWSTGSGIHATTAIIGKLSEKAFATVVAHELGHYYRAHGSSAYSAKYDFWYQRDVHEPKRPVAAEDAKKLASHVKTLMSARSTMAVASQKLSPRTTGWLVSYSFRNALGASPGCEDALALLKDGGFSGPLSYGGNLTEEQQAKYLAFEDALAACGSKVALVDANRQSFVSGVMAIFSAEKEDDFARSATLGELLERVETTARRYDEEDVAVREQLSKNHIGWYTTEQEADELAMELAVKVGITPREVLEAWLESMIMFEESYPSYGESDGTTIGASACKTLFENDFVTTKEDGTKELAYVPLGSLGDTHHAWCYRLFNLWREQDAHRYEAGKAPEELSPSWEEIQALASGRAKDGGASIDAGAAPDGSGP